tara:strand:+ start:28 stop:483 length:456 start_codon:yes stop_codon:yes gene_type:complete
MDTLPYPLYKYHKRCCKYSWKYQGMNFEGLFDEIYDIYIHTSKCDICNKPFQSSKDRHLEHDHSTSNEFNIRGIACTACNITKKDNKLRKDNKTGYKFIAKKTSKRHKQGFYYRLRIVRGGKNKLLYETKDLIKAIAVRNHYLKENPEIFS